MTQSTIPIPLPENQEEPDAADKNHNPYIIVSILALSIVVLLFYRLSGADIQSPEAVPGLQERVHSGYIYVDVKGAVVREGPYRLRVGSRVFDAIASAGGLRADADRRRVKMAMKLRDEMDVYVPRIGEADPAVSATPADPPDAGEQQSMLEPAPLEQPYEPTEPALPAEEPATPAVPLAASSPVPVAVPVETPEPVTTPKAPPVVPPAARVSINRADAAELERLPGIGPKLAQEIVEYRKGPPPRAFTSLQELANVPGIKENKLEEILPYVKL